MPPERSAPLAPDQRTGRPPYRPVHHSEGGSGGYRRPFEPAGTRPFRSPAPHPYPPLTAPEELGPDEELVAGRRPVEEAFVAGRPPRRLLVTPARRQALERIVLHATRLRIPIVEVEGGTLTALAGFDGHQGVALVVEPRRFATPEEILARAAERGEPPFVLVIDSLEDPQNLGTLLRSAEAAGIHGVLFPTHRQAPLTPAAIKASAGAVEHLLLAPVDDLAGALVDLHVRGLRVVGSDAEAPLTARQSDLRGPLALVVGSEGRGLGAAVRRRCDLLVRIPMRGAVGSLNAAVAGSVLLFEAVAQRDPEGRSAPPRPLPDDDAEPAAAVEVPSVPPSRHETRPGPRAVADRDAASAVTEPEGQRADAEAGALARVARAPADAAPDPADAAPDPADAAPDPADAADAAATAGGHPVATAEGSPSEETTLDPGSDGLPEYEMAVQPRPGPGSRNGGTGRRKRKSPSPRGPEMDTGPDGEGLLPGGPDVDPSGA